MSFSLKPLIPQSVPRDSSLSRYVVASTGLSAASSSSLSPDDGDCNANRPLKATEHILVGACYRLHTATYYRDACDTAITARGLVVSPVRGDAANENRIAFTGAPPPDAKSVCSIGGTMPPTTSVLPLFAVRFAGVMNRMKMLDYANSNGINHLK
jgi:hypothetical protein